MRRCIKILVVVLGISAMESQSPEISPVSLIAYNGKIVTVDANFAIHQAIAVSGEYVVALGSDQERPRGRWTRWAVRRRSRRSWATSTSGRP